MNLLLHTKQCNKSKTEEDVQKHPQISTNGSVFIQTFSCHVYLVEWERQDIRGGVLLPVDVIDLLHLLVVHADDTQVELLDA